MPYVITANYRHRGSHYKWLIREAGKPLDSARACKRIEATNARFTDSIDGEFHFGCTRVLVADTAVGFDFQDEQSLRPLKFTLSGFIDRESGRLVNGTLAAVKLDADGSVAGEFGDHQLEAPLPPETSPGFLQFTINWDPIYIPIVAELAPEPKSERSLDWLDAAMYSFLAAARPSYVHLPRRNGKSNFTADLLTALMKLPRPWGELRNEFLQYPKHQEELPIQGRGFRVPLVDAVVDLRRPEYSGVTVGPMRHSHSGYSKTDAERREFSRRAKMVPSFR